MSEDDGGDYNLDSFFICEDYVEKTWTFDDVSQSLLCSGMSSTDHDLTGQIVWPASEILSWFVCKNRHLFQDKVVLELGAGNIFYYLLSLLMFIEIHVLRLWIRRFFRCSILV